MKVYLVMANNYPLEARWTKARAESSVNHLEWSGAAAEVREIPIEPLHWLVDSYFLHRKYHEPNKLEAFIFLVSEIGELAGAIVQSLKSLWVRNNDHSKDSIQEEGGDVLMMLIKTGHAFGFDPLETMVAKWQRKGWDQDAR
jgi:NTP pyrophosphatase (non-canonical NTP hydrolase)